MKNRTSQELSKIKLQIMEILGSSYDNHRIMEAFAFAEKNKVAVQIMTDFNPFRYDVYVEEIAEWPYAEFKSKCSIDREEKEMNEYIKTNYDLVTIDPIHKVLKVEKDLFKRVNWYVDGHDGNHYYCECYQCDETDETIDVYWLTTEEWIANECWDIDEPVEDWDNIQQITSSDTERRFDSQDPISLSMLRESLSELIGTTFDPDEVKIAFSNFEWKGETEVIISNDSVSIKRFERVSVYINHVTAPVFHFYIDDGEISYIWDVSNSECLTRK